MAGTYTANQTLRADTGNVTLGANNDFIILAVAGFDTVGIQMTTGLTGTISYTASLDGTNFASLGGLTPLGSQASSNADTNPSGQVRVFDTTAYTFIRIQITSYGSGSSVVYWNCENSPAANGNANVNAVFPGSGATSLGKAEDAVHTSGDIGVAVWGVRNDAGAAAPTSADGDYTQLSTDAMGDLRVTAPRSNITTGSHGQHRLVSAATTNATSVKGSAGNIYAVVVANSNAAVRYVKFYNKATAPTVGTDIPVLVIAVPPTSTITLQLNLVPFALTTGVAYATTTGAADADTAAVALSDILMTLFYV